MVTYKSWNFPYLSHFEEGWEHNATKFIQYQHTQYTQVSFKPLFILDGTDFFFYM